MVGNVAIDLESAALCLKDEVIRLFVTDEPVPNHSKLLIIANQKLGLTLPDAREAIAYMEQQHAQDLAEAGYDPQKDKWRNRQAANL